MWDIYHYKLIFIRFSKSHMCGVVASSNQHNLVGLGKRCRHLKRHRMTLLHPLCLSDLCCNLRKSLKHKRENGGISVLLVGARLHPHPLGLGPEKSFQLQLQQAAQWMWKPANRLSCSCLSSTDQADLLTISSGGFNSFCPGDKFWYRDV